MSSKQEVLGLLVKHLHDYLKETYGDLAYQRLLGALDPDSRLAFSEKFLVTGWYPMRSHLNFYNVICRELHGGNVKAGFDMGKMVANKNLNIFIKLFLWFKDPTFIIKRSSITWTMFYRPSRFEYEFTGPMSAWVRVVGMDLEPGDRFYCYILGGHFTKFLESSGVKDVSIVESRCKCLGDPYCQYEASWK